MGSGTFEQDDEALDEQIALDPAYLEAVEVDPSLDPANQLDSRALENAGALLDDPEAMVTLEGGIPDPDGLGRPTDAKLARIADLDGWDLDAPVVRGDDEIDT